MKNQPIDVIKILDGLNQLNELIEQPLAKEALSIDTNIETNAQSQNLARLRYSLTQYKEKGRDLLYVGFMGHFSSGKSSTINSLLGLTKHKNVRDTDLNPTDQQITLITHENNKKDVLIPVRESLVPIRAEFIDNPLLRNIVLADTPGTGDPLLIKEMARDFLPICDLILYCFSSTNALDHTDIPILKEKYSQLEFIPMQFLITRADEFEIEKLPLTKENFDAEKAEKFQKELVRRLEKTIGFPIDYQEDFFLIDNNEGFNIPELRHHLTQMAELDGLDQRISLHSHKIHYFRSSAKVVQDFFEQFLQERVLVLQHIVKEAEQNIFDYQDGIQITNNYLTENWTKSLSKIERLSETSISAIPPIGLGPEKLKSFVFPDSKDKQKLEKLLKEEAQHEILKIKESVRGTVANCLTQAETQIQDDMREIFQEDIVSEEAYVIAVPSVELVIPPEFIDIDPKFDFIEQSKGIHRQGYNKLDSRKEKLSKNVKTLQGQLQKFEPMIKQQAEIDNAVESLSSDLDGFFRNVSIYRTGVFAQKTMEAIAVVGIGRQLDDLRVLDFSEEEKNNIKERARKRIFPIQEDEIIVHREKFKELNQECEKVTQFIHETQLAVPLAIEEIPDSTLLREKNNQFYSKLNEHLREGSREHISNVVAKINEMIQQETNTYVRKSGELKNKQRTNSLQIISLVVFIFVLVYFIFATANIGYIGEFTDKINQGLGLEEPIENNVIQTPASGESLPNNELEDTNSSQSIKGTTIFNGLIVIVAIIGVGIGYLINLAVNNYSKKQEKQFKQYASNIQEKKDKILQEISVDKPLEQMTSLVETLELSWKELLLDEPFDQWESSGTDYLTAIKSLESKYMQLRDPYIVLVETITTESSSYFRNREQNIEYLVDIAREIRNQAIEPSFNLLENTRDQLQDVKDKLARIEFI